MNKLVLVVLVAVFLLCQIQTAKCEEKSLPPQTTEKSLSRETSQRYSRNSHIEVMRRRLANVWNLVSKQFSNPNPDSFIGRCIGAAKGLKVAMPLIIFKLGVIVTIVAFLAVFSLKSIGLLVTLLIFNITGAFSKLALLFQHNSAPAAKFHTPPQTVHFHLHNKGEDGGGYGIKHSGPSQEYVGGWSERNAINTGGNYQGNELDRVELQNLYRRLGISRTSDGRIVLPSYEQLYSQ